MKRIAIASALLAIALTSCQREDPNNIAIDEGNNAAAVIETLPPDETATNEDEANVTDNEALPTPPDAAGATIPAQYHGRWGMVPGDCTSTRGDNKGLITIADRTVKFYEATATLKEQRPAIATSFAGLFGFTGEGQSWQKVMTFTRTGDTLKRAEESGTFTYQRCA
jgi:hypothetical protein